MKKSFRSYPALLVLCVFLSFSFSSAQAAWDKGTQKPADRHQTQNRNGAEEGGSGSRTNDGTGYGTDVESETANSVTMISMGSTQKKYCTPVVSHGGLGTIKRIKIKLSPLQQVHIYWYMNNNLVYDYLLTVDSWPHFHDPFSQMPPYIINEFNSIGLHTARIVVNDLSNNLIVFDEKSYEIVPCSMEYLTLGSPSSQCLGEVPDSIPATFLGDGSGSSHAVWTDESGRQMSVNIPEGQFNAIDYLPAPMTDIFNTAGCHYLRLDAQLDPTSDIYVSDTVPFDIQPCQPAITSFSPTYGGPGTSVIITGSHFTGTEVTFGGTPAASFVVDSDTQITAVVGQGSTGKVAVTTAGGVGESATDFTFLSVFPGTYYVDIENGNDNNDGSAVHPWKTLHHAVSRINGGEPGEYTLFVALGTYSVAKGEADESMAITQNGVTVTGESGSAPVINGSGATHWHVGFSVEASNVTVHNFHITGFSGEGEMGIEFNSGSDIAVEGCSIYGNNEGVDMGATSGGNTVKGCDVYQNSQGIVCYGPMNIISENRIHGNVSDGIFVEDSGPEISRNELYDNLNGITVSATSSNTASPVIRNNRIYETTDQFMAYGILIRGNGGTLKPTLYHNSIDGGSGDGIAVEQATTSTLEPVIKYNIVTRCDSYGIDVMPGINSTIDHNDIWQNTLGNYNGCSAGPRDISRDPRNGQAGELDPTSPCIDAIGPTEGDPVTLDYSGYERPKGTGFDMGAYEYVGAMSNKCCLPGGTGQLTDYRIFTVPFSMTGARMLAEMEANLGGYDPSRWRVFAYLGSTYIEIHSEDFAVLNIMPGMGFWIITTLTDVIPFWGPIPPDGVDYELTIPSGWSLVALPWTGTDIDLGNIQVTDGSNRYSITSASNNLTQRCLWHYTGSGPHNGYEKLDLSTDRLQCGTGYFFKVLTTDAVRVIFPPVNTVRRDETGERGSPGDEEEPPPPPGGSQQQSPCPDIFNGRLENVAYPRGVHCQYIHRGKLTIGNGVTVPEGTTVTFRADEADIEGSMTVSRGAQVTIQATRVHMRSPFHAEEGALVRIRQP